LATRAPDAPTIPQLPWSVQMAQSVIRRNVPFQWHYEHGLALLALGQVGQRMNDPQYFDYVKGTIDPFIDPQGNIRTYRIEEYNLDQINAGKILFPLYKTTGDERYRQALCLLREQLRDQPRTGEGGFWHKKIYPYQMWLDGIYMASPFYAEFAKTFAEPAAFDDVANQILLMEKHAHDPKTGLLYHAWDESKQQRWANPTTGCSPSFWGRAIGWYAMAIVDVLDYMPDDHPRRTAILAILDRMIGALANFQDRPTGLWYQVLDQGNRAGNYVEASCSCMFIYAIAKGIRKGYLADRFLEAAEQGYRGVLENLIEIDECGEVNLNGICAVGGLGGDPYRDGLYEYYVSEPVVTNDYKGVGAFILASAEMENLDASRGN
jgi:unsaturated rhamnogalacturonyl hydrolase